jgi:DNA-binding IclR family transcriptional regulator
VAVQFWSSVSSASPFGVISAAISRLPSYVDALAKVILSTLPDTDEDTRANAVARGKLRYSRLTLMRRFRNW